MTRSSAILVVASGLLLGTQPLFAQAVGDRVRVTTDADSRVIGRIAVVRGDGFELGMDGGRSGYFTHADILRLERSLGRGSRWKEGLLYGGAGGFLAGFVIAEALIYATCDVVTLGTATDECEGEGLDVSLAVAAIWGAVGGALGLGIGALTRGPERWEQIDFGGAYGGFGPIFNLQLNSGRVTAVLGARLRL